MSGWFRSFPVKIYVARKQQLNSTLHSTLTARRTPHSARSAQDTLGSKILMPMLCSYRYISNLELLNAQCLVSAPEHVTESQYICCSPSSGRRDRSHSPKQKNSASFQARPMAAMTKPSNNSEPALVHTKCVAPQTSVERQDQQTYWQERPTMLTEGIKFLSAKNNTIESNLSESSHQISQISDGSLLKNTCQSRYSTKRIAICPNASCSGKSNISYESPIALSTRLVTGS
ncbi:hypothetical protein BO82DRAFT_44508 [Aspergillus uvarum CBS 121591]|uniref:Uncharacterized protein n=1 Tax=Aspergillus uvarum CBS 121591 TaxID=1448315 RepID=A0A319DWM7_9EURO|nr:hypothetical protein BO82DRAFT_44508 [Aspergillus uvarum CBS 121591]PYH83312.1 hypothetical protein BO82DRAFT_44508 [Aspergillus uvarum CBS 121591]